MTTTQEMIRKSQSALLQTWDPGMPAREAMVKARMCLGYICYERRLGKMVFDPSELSVLLQSIKGSLMSHPELANDEVVEGENHDAGNLYGLMAHAYDALASKAGFRNLYCEKAAQCAEKGGYPTLATVLRMQAKDDSVRYRNAA